MQLHLNEQLSRLHLSGMKQALNQQQAQRVIPPFLGAFKSRGHAAFARCCFGV